MSDIRHDRTRAPELGVCRIPATALGCPRIGRYDATVLGRRTRARNVLVGLWRIPPGVTCATAQA